MQPLQATTCPTASRVRAGSTLIGHIVDKSPILIKKDGRIIHHGHDASGYERPYLWIAVLPPCETRLSATRYERSRTGLPINPTRETVSFRRRYRISLMADHIRPLADSYGMLAAFEGLS